MSTTGDDEGVRPAGRFRVYLGAAAGVGKTCAMLDEGWRRFQRGADVVVGFVETHKRAYTIEQIRDLPVVPRRQVTYRDAEWEEMDLDAVLARHPEVVLIDELEELVKAVGGRWHSLESDNVAKAIFAFAVDQQITQIVLGTSRLTRWQSVTRGSVIQQILRMASDNDIDVHVIARRDDANGRLAAPEDG